jgi:hypothetical protein
VGLASSEALCRVSRTGPLGKAPELAGRAKHLPSVKTWDCQQRFRFHIFFVIFHFPSLIPQYIDSFNEALPNERF